MTESIVWKSAAHKSRFLSSMQQIGKVYDGKLDPEYGAALYILTADSGTWNKAQDYVSSQGILFEELLKEVDFSGGYQVLIQFAANLFNEHAMPALNAVELMRLDDNNYRVALSALVVRRHSLRVDDLK